MTTDWTPPGPGPWQQDSAHMPVPSSPIIGDIYPANFRRGFEEALSKYGSLLDRLEMQVVNGYTYHQVQPFDMPGPDGPPSEEQIGAEIGRRAAVAEEALEARVWRDDIARWDKELKPASIARHRELYAVDLGELTTDQLVAHAGACVDHLGEMVFQHHRFNSSALVPVGDFMLTVAPWVHRPPQTLFSLLDGYSEVSGAVPPEMAPVVDALKGDAGAASLLDGEGDPHERLVALASAVKEVAELEASIGYRIVDGFDVVNPTIGERPELLLGKISAALQADPGASRARADAEAAALRAGLDPEQQARFDDLLAEARLVYRLRDERGIYSDISAIGLLRLAMLEVGRRMQSDAKIDDPELALYLTADELADAAAGGGPAGEELVARQSRRLQLRAEGAPRLLGPPPPEPPPTDGLPPHLARIESGVGFVISGILGELDDAVGDATVIGGISASAGVYEGRARHVQDVDDLFTLEPGDVLLAPTTGEAFNSVIHLLGAIVTDHGSFASHAGIVAREMGFPAVVGTTNATTRIPDGARVRVDGDAGEVHVLS